MGERTDEEEGMGNDHQSYQELSFSPFCCGDKKKGVGWCCEAGI